MTFTMINLTVTITLLWIACGVGTDWAIEHTCLYSADFCLAQKWKKYRWWILAGCMTMWWILAWMIIWEGAMRIISNVKRMIK